MKHCQQYIKEKYTVIFSINDSINIKKYDTLNQISDEFEGLTLNIIKNINSNRYSKKYKWIKIIKNENPILLKGNTQKYKNKYKTKNKN